MPDIAIFIKSVGQGPSSGTLRIWGIAYTEGFRDLHEWIADVAINASSAVINGAIKDAAIDIASRAGVVVGVLDAKTMFGGAVAL